MHTLPSYTGSGLSTSPREPEVFTGNALQWALKRADRALNEVEQQPPELAREAFKVVNSPAGKLVGMAATEAAKVSVEVGKEVIKAALPVAKTAAGMALNVAIDLLKTQTKSSSSSGAGKKDSSSSSGSEGGKKQEGSVAEFTDAQADTQQAKQSP